MRGEIGIARLITRKKTNAHRSFRGAAEKLTLVNIPGIELHIEIFEIYLARMLQ